MQAFINEVHSVVGDTVPFQWPHVPAQPEKPGAASSSAKPHESSTGPAVAAVVSTAQLHSLPAQARKAGIDVGSYMINVAKSATDVWRIYIYIMVLLKASAAALLPLLSAAAGMSNVYPLPMHAYTPAGSQRSMLMRWYPWFMSRMAATVPLRS